MSVRYRQLIGLLVALAGVALSVPHAPGFDSRSAHQPDDAATKPKGLLGIPDGVDVIRGIEYAKAGEHSLKLDVYTPSAKPGTDKPAPLPVIIWIHGGGWESGTRSACPAAQLVPHGYAAVSISYRFSQVAPYPAQIHDCKAAVRWVRAHAKEHNIDPARIGVWGASAGGHLVALLGTSGGDAELEGSIGGNVEHSSRVQAVCNWFGPTDLIKLCRMAGGETAAEAALPRDGYTPPVPAVPSAKPANEPQPSTASSPTSTPADPSGGSGVAAARRTKVPTPRPILKLLGGKIEDQLALAAGANPITYIDASDAPFLIVHGDADTLVPIDQSRILLDALKRSGVEATLHTVKGGGHGFWNDELLQLVRAFFDEELAIKSPAPVEPKPTPK